VHRQGRDPLNEREQQELRRALSLANWKAGQSIERGNNRLEHEKVARLQEEH
jgi:hypothetical protein